MRPSDEFRFLDPGSPSDGELQLQLVALKPADPLKNWVPAYEFEMRVPGSGGPVGKISLRARSTVFLEMYGGQIGYTVEPPHRGRHYAERAVRLLIPFIRRHGLKAVWITCNPENRASRRTCERLGAQFVEIVDLPPDCDMYLRGERRKCRYRLDL